MDASVSSARPRALDSYSAASGVAAARLEHEARRLDEALARFAAACAEYPVPQAAGIPAELRAGERAQAELCAWVSLVGAGFRRADSPRLLSGSPTLRPDRRPDPPGAVDAAVDAAWNRAARDVYGSLTLLEERLREGESVKDTLALPAIAIPLLRAGLSLSALIVLTDHDDWARLEGAGPDDGLILLMRGLWDNKHRIDPELFQRIAKRLHQIAAHLARIYPQLGHARPAEGAEAEPLRSSGELDLPAEDLFPRPPGQPAQGAYFPRVDALMSGPHSIISYYRGEQVSMMRTARGHYLIGIAGLDPQNMGVSPNGTYAVALTADGRDPEANPYYLHVRERFLADLERVPPGSQIHLVGHSMGGGMVFTLLNDTVVLNAIRAAGARVGSAITLSAVRPSDPARDEVRPGGPDGSYADILGDAVVLHYVNPDDRLAANNGAGHEGYADVIEMGSPDLEEPTAAHSSPGDPAAYEGLPPELQLLPIPVDPEYVKVYPRTAPAEPVSPFPFA